MVYQWETMGDPPDESFKVFKSVVDIQFYVLGTMQLLK